LQQGSLVICEQCDAAHRWRPLLPHEIAQCRRCGAVLGRGHHIGVHALLALTIAALFVLLIANLAPVVDVRLRGIHNSATLPGSIHDAWVQGERLVALAAAFTAIVAPAFVITLRLCILVPLARARTPRHLGWCLRVMHEMSRWSMVEVMMVAAVVCIVRIASMAQAEPGPGMFAFGALALLLAALESSGVKHLWRQPP
jgi:paraquat-inducible protein A